MVLSVDGIIDLMNDSKLKHHNVELTFIGARSGKKFVAVLVDKHSGKEIDFDLIGSDNLDHFKGVLVNMVDKYILTLG